MLIPGSEARVGWVNRMIGAAASHTPLDAVQLGNTDPANRTHRSSQRLGR